MSRVMMYAREPDCRSITSRSSRFEFASTSFEWVARLLDWRRSEMVAMSSPNAAATIAARTPLASSTRARIPSFIAPSGTRAARRARARSYAGR